MTAASGPKGTFKAAGAAAAYQLNDGGLAPQARQVHRRDDGTDVAAALVAALLAPGLRGTAAREMAQALLARFGTLDGVLLAAAGQSPALLALGAAVCAKLARVAQGMGRLAADPPPMTLALFDHVVDSGHGTLPTETLRVVLLDEVLQPIASRTFGHGAADHCAVDPETVATFAAAAAARGVVLVHNHPSGDPQPSPPDVLATRRIELALRERGIRLLDHVVTAGRRRLSMRALGMLGV